jgi:predicted esterase
MHGMTGDASMMRPFAEKILPEGWTLIVPEARYNHPLRGRTWWRYEDEDADATRRMTLISERTHRCRFIPFTT